MRWLILLILLPTAGAIGLDNPMEPTQVTLYPHLVANDDLPMNTQEPAGDWSYGVGLGLATHSQGCVDVPLLGLASTVHHSFYAYPYPALLDYNELRREPVRGLYHDLRLDTNVTPTLDWYLQVDASPNVQSIEGALAQVQVTATLREGDAISVNHEAMNQGRILARGQSDPALLAGPATDGADYEEGIYHFQVELPYLGQDLVVPKEQGFNLRVDLHVDIPGCNDPGERYVMPDMVRIHTSPGHRPTLDWSILNPVVIESFSTRVVNDTATATALVNTPWGPYNLQNPQFALTPEVPVQQTIELTPRHQRLPMHTHWTWEPTADANVTLQAFDLQGNGPAMADLPFEVGDTTTTCTAALDRETLCHSTEAKKDSPAAALLLPLLAALLFRRRAQ